MNSSGEYAGTSDSLTIDDPHINVTSVTRYSNSNSSGGNTDRNQYYVCSLDNSLSSEKAAPMLSCYGRAGDTSTYAWNNYNDNETCTDHACENYSTSFRWHFRDNNSDGSRDPYEIYFVVFG
jgi:hypothetical protein